jgi:hypothetical protein
MENVGGGSRLPRRPSVSRPHADGRSARTAQVAVKAGGDALAAVRGGAASKTRAGAPATRTTALRAGERRPLPREAGGGRRVHAPR